MRTEMLSRCGHAMNEWVSGNGRLQIVEEIGQRPGQGLSAFFMNDVEFPEDMGQAERKQTGEFEICLQAIMDESTQEFGQDGKTIQRL